MKLFFFLSFLALVTPGHGQYQYSETTERLQELICLSWETVEQEYEFNSVEEMDRVKESHRRTRQFLLSGPKRVEAALAAGNKEQAILTCAFLEDATLGFATSCLDDSGQEIVLAGTTEACLSLHR